MLASSMIRRMQSFQDLKEAPVADLHSIGNRPAWKNTWPYMIERMSFNAHEKHLLDNIMQVG
jgi:hypothetical protein